MPSSPSRRLLAPVVALTLVGGAACARQDPVPSPTTATTGPAAPVPSPSTTVATPSPSPPPSPSPAALEIDQLISSINDCAQGGCTVKAHLTSRSGPIPLEFALVRMPGEPDAVEVPLRMALFDHTTQELTWQSAVLRGVPGGEGGHLAIQDAAGHIALTLGMGAHASTLYVIDPADGVHVRFFGNQDDQTGSAKGYVSNMPSARAEDLDGDDVFELVVPVDDCEPSCADGTITEYLYRWNGSSDYVPSDCRVFPSGSDKGTAYAADHPKCKTS